MDSLMDVKVLLSLLESMNIGVVFVDPDGIIRYCNAAAQVMKKLQPEQIIGREVRCCHPKKYHDKLFATIEVMKEKKVPNWQRIAVHNEPNLENMVSPVFTPDGEFLGIVLIVLDVTGQRELTDRLRKSERELTALFKASHTISSSLNLNDVLFKILLLVGEAINFSAGTVYLLDEEKELIVPMAATDCLIGGRNPETIDYYAVDNVIAFSVRSGEMVTLESNKPGFSQVHCKPGTMAVLVLPLKEQEETLGVLVIESEDPGLFDMEVQSLLTTFANHAAVAIRNAQLFTKTKKMAIMDGLTGLFNRQYFDQILSQATAQARRRKGDLTIIMVDVNDLKFINDYFGHVMGDYVIKAAAEILQRSVRDTDTVCRYGGDEIVILLPNTSEDEASIINTRILENVENWNDEENDQSDVVLSLSIGCATAHGKSGLSDLLARADKNMYEDKRKYKSAIGEENPIARAKQKYYSG